MYHKNNKSYLNDFFLKLYTEESKGPVNSCGGIKLCLSASTHTWMLYQCIHSKIPFFHGKTFYTSIEVHMLDAFISIFNFNTSPLCSKLHQIGARWRWTISFMSWTSNVIISCPISHAYANNTWNSNVKVIWWCDRNSNVMFI